MVSLGNTGLLSSAQSTGVQEKKAAGVEEINGRWNTGSRSLKRFGDKKKVKILAARLF